MSVHDGNGRGVASGEGGAPPAPPPPAPTLLKAVEQMQPVRMRSRFTAFAVVLVAGLIWPAVSMLIKPLRQDMVCS